MFTKADIDLDKLHGQLRGCFKRQVELRRSLQGKAHPIVPLTTADDFTEAYKRYRENRAPFDEFESLGLRMTVLCCILAHARGRLHVQKLTKRWARYAPPIGGPIELLTVEDQARLIGDQWEEFKKVTESSSAQS
jgi:hypothetical protein